MKLRRRFILNGCFRFVFYGIVEAVRIQPQNLLTIRRKLTFHFNVFDRPTSRTFRDFSNVVFFTHFFGAVPVD